MRTILTFAFCLAALTGAAPAGAQQYRVIVNAANPGAIGYVSSETQLTENVKTIPVTR